MSKVVIIGAGKIAEELYFYLTHDSEHDVVAFAVDKNFIVRKKLQDLPVIDIKIMKSIFPTSDFKVLVAMGYQNINRLRTLKYNQVKEMGYSCISYISSNAYNIGKVSIGENCIILENNTINPTSKIGNNNVLWCGNHIGHHSIIDNNCFIAGHVIISGSSRVNSNTFIGVNSSIGHQITIGSENIIGANSLITKNTKPKSVFINKDSDLYKLDSEYFTRLTRL